MTRSRRHKEDFIMADLDLSKDPDKSWGLTKSAWSFREFGALLAEAINQVAK